MLIAKSRGLTLFTVSLLLVLTGCHKATRATPDIDAPAIVTKMDRTGIIEHPKRWAALMKQTEHGQKIKSVRELNQVLQQGNRHSFVATTPKQFEDINAPSISAVRGYRVLNVPSFFSTDDAQTQKYQQQLRRCVTKLKDEPVLILNFAHNRGGDYRPMIAGLAAVIPRGTLWSEVDKHGHAKPVVMTTKRIYGGLNKQSMTYRAPRQRTDQKVLLIMDNRTGSAAE
ncbi:S41 family peptidase [Lactiplantibacillus plajomi]|uniref:S41 family peptidase n=1 Tax=Lactiplantibacillus plajomi TaxID=1457217 RepID=A0ABV6K568_9LACO|nr:S41 family peptidase [Lactiplantibacillus plajomi]